MHKIDIPTRWKENRYFPRFPSSLASVLAQEVANPDLRLVEFFSTLGFCVICSDASMVEIVSCWINVRRLYSCPDILVVVGASIRRACSVLVLQIVGSRSSDPVFSHAFACLTDGVMVSVMLVWKNSESCSAHISFSRTNDTWTLFLGSFPVCF
jgi:hypothetical protein